MSEVFVSAVHPKLGRLYWVHTPADVGYPDHRTVTDWSELATKFPKSWRDHDYLHWLHRSHISKVFDPDDVFADYAVEDDEENEIHEQRLSGLLAGLHEKSEQSVEEFRLWMIRADWVDVPALQFFES